MSEGINENPPLKDQIKRMMRGIRESMPWDPIGKKKRSIKPIPSEVLQQMDM